MLSSVQGRAGSRTSWGMACPSFRKSKAGYHLGGAADLGWLKVCVWHSGELPRLLCVVLMIKKTGRLLGAKLKCVRRQEVWEEALQNTCQGRCPSSSGDSKARLSLYVHFVLMYVSGGLIHMNVEMTVPCRIMRFIFLVPILIC